MGSAQHRRRHPVAAGGLERPTAVDVEIKGSAGASASSTSTTNSPNSSTGNSSSTTGSTSSSGSTTTSSSTSGGATAGAGPARSAPKRPPEDVDAAGDSALAEPDRIPRQRQQGRPELVGASSTSAQTSAVRRRLPHLQQIGTVAHESGGGRPVGLGLARRARSSWIGGASSRSILPRGPQARRPRRRQRWYGSAAASPAYFIDTAVPQDSCQAGVGMSFGKVSQPDRDLVRGEPFVSGVGPNRPHGRSRDGPEPRSSYAAPDRGVEAGRRGVQVPGRGVAVALSVARQSRRVGTPATSVVLPLTKGEAGVWYYRVRGHRRVLCRPGRRAMAWSAPGARCRVDGQPASAIVRS